MYAYSNESFEAFDRRMVELLKRGFVRDILKKLVSPKLLSRVLGTMLTAGITAKTADLLRMVFCGVQRLFGVNHQAIAKCRNKIQPPLMRRFTRTDAFEEMLCDKIFGDLKLSSPTRNGVNIVINACELRTGTAFRFGSRESGCWRYGRLLNPATPIALAVAASAAYPVILPGLDRELEFVDQQGHRRSSRVVLTDGGIFDNLGITCMEPGRTEGVSYNVYRPKYIILCDAGAGQFSNDVVPYWWPTRMIRAFDSVFRKVQNGAYQRLHTYAATGALSGFVMCYLGQQDDKLSSQSPGFVPREDVVSYPTDFSPMPEESIGMLSSRGETIMRTLLERYRPEL